MLNLGSFPNALNDIPVTTTVGGKSVQTYSNKCVNQRKVMVNINPSTSVPTNIWNSGAIEFRIEKGAIDRISGNGVWLRIGYTNSSGAACVLAAPNAWPKNVGVYVNNGGQLIYTHNDAIESFLINHIHISRNEYENLAFDSYRSNASYSTAPITIADGETGYIWLNLCVSLWKAVHFRPYMLDGNNILIRINFNPASVNIVSGTMTCTECVLRISGYMESDEAKKAVMASKVPRTFFYYAPQRHIETLTLAPSSVYNIRMSGITGDVNQLIFAIRSAANGAAPAGQFTFARAANFEILDGGNVSVTGHTPILDSEMILNYSHQYDNLFALYNNFSIYSFSQTPVGDVKTGTINGYERMEGFHTLRFTTRSTLVAGSYTVYIIAMCNETLTIMNGRATATRA